MQTVWTYEALTCAVESKMQAFADMARKLPSKPAALDGERAAFLSQALGVRIIWDEITREVRREEDALRLEAIVEVMREDFCTHASMGSAAEQGWKEERAWSDVELAATVRKLKELIPQAWREICDVETAGGDIAELNALALELVHLTGMYPGVELLDVLELHQEVCSARRKELGLI